MAGAPRLPALRRPRYIGDRGSGAGSESEARPAGWRKARR